MSNLVIDVQRRHADVFRIRLGDKDGNRPRKLTDAIRVTSPDRAIVQAFCDRYGGEPQPWTDDRNEWQAYLPTTSLNVRILPGQSVYQRWETYRRSVCVKRCNGEWDEIAGKPCSCPPDIEARMADRNACNLMTRITVVCPDVAVLGAGSLVSHGLIAAQTLPSAIAVVDAALQAGVQVPAILRVVEHKGRNHYVVPQLVPHGASIEALEAGQFAGELGGPPPTSGTPAVGGAPAGALPAGSAGGVGLGNAPDQAAPTGSHTQRTGSAGGVEGRQEVCPDDPEARRAASVTPTSSHTPGPQAGTTADDGVPPSPPAVGVDGGGVETLAGDSPAPVVSATTLLIATGKTAGAAVVALKRAAAEVSPDGPFMADEIAADPAFAAKVLAHLGGMPADGTTPKATYTQKQNGWIHAVWANHGGDDARKAYLSRLTSGRTDSSSELTAAEKKAYLEKTEELS